MSIRWIESVLNRTCNQNTNLTVTFQLRSFPGLSSALGRKFKLPTLGSLPHVLGLSVPPLQPRPSYLSSSQPHSSHARLLAFTFLFCWEPFWQTLIHILWVSSTGPSSQSQFPSPVVLWQRLPLSSTTPCIYCSYVIWLLSLCLPLSPTNMKTCLEELRLSFNLGSAMCDLGQSCFSSLSLRFLICKMGRKQGNSCDSQYLAYSQVQC